MKLPKYHLVNSMPSPGNSFMEAQIKGDGLVSAENIETVNNLKYSQSLSTQRKTQTPSVADKAIPERAPSYPSSPLFPHVFLLLHSPLLAFFLSLDDAQVIPTSSKQPTFTRNDRTKAVPISGLCTAGPSAWNALLSDSAGSLPPFTKFSTQMSPPQRSLLSLQNLQ